MTAHSIRKLIIIAAAAVAIAAAAIALVLGVRGASGDIPAGTRLSVYVTNELMCYREPCG